MLGIMALCQTSRIQTYQIGNSPWKGKLRVLARQQMSKTHFRRLVERPFTLTLRQLIAEYEQITCPVTLVCAGNRRKEQNQVRKSKGFSWGAAGVSTALFTGVAMSELIKRARPRKKARFVCMEGADKLVWAMLR